MGVSSTINRVPLAGDGVTTTFPFGYYFFEQADLKVYVYDTLLGGVTGPLVLNTDYTITGSVNYQGLYPNGGVVVFSTYVPLSTDIVVIYRAPVEEQLYSLDSGGTISSYAIVQQFDYLTLLVQRLTDQVARCIQVPDGVGAAFSGALPNNVAFVPGASPIVNTLGTGWDLSPGSGGGGGGGSVTSVALSLPASVFTISGSPVVGAGTLTGTFATQLANKVFAGPAAGAAAVPTMRSLVVADLPVVDTAHGGTGLAAAGVVGNVLTSNGATWVSAAPPSSASSTVTNGGNANYTILSTDQYVRSGTALTANRNWTLPAATTVGQKIIVKNLISQGFDIILLGAAFDTIDGAASVTLSPGISVTLICGASGFWDVI